MEVKILMIIIKKILQKNIEKKSLELNDKYKKLIQENESLKQENKNLHFKSIDNLLKLKLKKK